MGRAKPPTTDLSPSSLPPDHILVQLGIPKGSNNYLCSDPEGTERLVEIGAKIRKAVLATRGDFAIVRLFPPNPDPKAAEKEREKTGSLAGEIIHVASNKDVKDWKRAGEWPSGFGEAPAPPPQISDEEDEQYSDEYDEEREDGEEQDEDHSGETVPTTTN